MMDHILYAADLAGHCNELTAWRIIKQVSGQLMSHSTMPVSPFNIKINEDGSFALVENAVAEADTFMAPEATKAAPTEAGQVWSLAASVFYLVMGCQIMNGKGGKGQHATSKVPYMRSEFAKLSELVQQCLQYRPELRPSAKEVNEMSSEQYKQCLEVVSRGPKFREKTDTADKTKDIDNELAFWPEPMRQ